MITSASTNSWSNLEFSPSLSEVVTRVCPCSSSHFRIPSSFSVVPRSSGTCSIVSIGSIDVVAVQVSFPRKELNFQQGRECN